MEFKPNNNSAFDELLNNIITESNNNLYTDQDIESIQIKGLCPKIRKFFYNKKPCLYKSLIIFLILIFIESYTFISSCTGYIICLHVTHNTHTRYRILTDNSFINNIITIHIVLLLISIISLCSIFYNGDIIFYIL